MDHMKVLKRAWEIFYHYRMLWVFGFILSLVGAEGGGGGNSFQMSQSSFNNGGNMPTGRPFVAPEVPGDVWAIAAGAILALICVGVIVAIVVTVVRYVMETSLIRMVDEHEKTQEKVGFRAGFRMGWSRTALRLFLIDLIVNIPVALVFGILFALALLPLLVWAVDSTALQAVGTGATACLFFIVIVLVIVVNVALSVLRGFFWRACVLEELGVVDSLRRGYAFVKLHLADVLVMWLITIGLALLWSLIMIPVALLLVILGGIVAAIPGLLVGALASLAFQEAVPWVLAAVVSIPIFILVMVIPLTFLDGLMKGFQSTTWTLTYRELQALEG
ncbi:MAG: hypothetical protein KKA73_29110 [Chloroflexi bacterium]|nr:hypothetical protein [Chloroflexota bacterium]MBU1751755.1 hypothetical protein [Chloroflexota bacterium]MBU1877579.1 hypothetical protein [Chloroflexota bacterium]